MAAAAARQRRSAASRAGVAQPSGFIPRARWKARIDQYRDVDFGPYVEEGLVLAHYLVDEPDEKQSWGGQEISRADLEDMARYSKSIWPTLPTVVRATPAWLAEGHAAYPDLDIFVAGVQDELGTLAARTLATLRPALGFS